MPFMPFYASSRYCEAVFLLGTTLPLKIEGNFKLVATTIENTKKMKITINGQRCLRPQTVTELLQGCSRVSKTNKRCTAQ